MSNIDSFNEITAKVLEHLLEVFPQGINLTAEEFVDSADRNDVANFAYTIQFLSKEDLLSYDEVTGGGEIFLEVILSGKGLAALNAIPDVLQEKKPFSQKITGALKSGSKEVLKSAINEFITAVATGRISFFH